MSDERNISDTAKQREREVFQQLENEAKGKKYKDEVMLGTQMEGTIDDHLDRGVILTPAQHAGMIIRDNLNSSVSVDAQTKAGAAGFEAGEAGLDPAYFGPFLDEKQRQRFVEKYLIGEENRAADIQGEREE